MTSSMTSQGGLQVSLYIHVKERLAPGANWKGNVSSINVNIIIVFLGYTCQKTISINNTFEIASQRSTSQAYWVTLALISSIANYLKYNNFFWACDGIDNVTLRLWKFSDFCSTQCRRRGWWYHVPHSSVYIFWIDIHCCYLCSDFIVKRFRCVPMYTILYKRKLWLL